MDREWPQRIGVDYREHGGIQTQRRADGAHHRQRESRRFAETTQGVPYVLHHTLEPAESPHRAAILQRHRHATEGRAACHLPVEPHFLFQAGFKLRPPPPVPNPFPYFHGVSITRAIPANRNRKLRSSSLSCFRPVAVIR